MTTSINPGRELDKEIATKIMGESFHPIQYTRTTHRGPSLEPPTPFYSTDITAAWKVVEKIKTMNIETEWGRGEFTLKYELTGEPHWVAGWYPESGPGDRFMEHQVDGVTAAHAICLAALKTLKD